MQELVFAFDLDGTVTAEETLPLLARELGLFGEMEKLTARALAGDDSFAASFRRRYEMLKDIPLEKIQAVMAKVPLEENIAAFIKESQQRVVLVTGNLDLWAEPIAKKLGCKCYSSKSARQNGEIILEEIIDKGAVIAELRKEYRHVVAIGDSFNDIPMFAAADISLVFAGVHMPPAEAVEAADLIAISGEELVAHLTAIAGRRWD